MKTGRISKPEETFIKENVNFGYQKLALSLDRNPDSVLDFIKRKVAKNEIEKPSWFDSISTEDQAKYDLAFRPYFVELKQQFTEDELKLFQYHWSRIISQFQDVSRPPLMSQLPGGKYFNTFGRRASSHYVALKTQKSFSVCITFP